MDSLSSKIMAIVREHERRRVREETVSLRRALRAHCALAQSQAKKKIIRRLYASGIAMAEIGRTLGLSPRRVAQIIAEKTTDGSGLSAARVQEAHEVIVRVCREGGVEATTALSKRRAFVELRRKMCRDLDAMDFSSTEIARFLGLHHTSVLYLLGRTCTAPERKNLQSESGKAA